jgi:hypothetical protein
MEMLRIASLISGGGINDPEGAAINAQAMETLLRNQQIRLNTCPVTKGLDTAGKIVADGIQTGRRQADAHIAFRKLPTQSL